MIDVYYGPSLWDPMHPGGATCVAPSHHGHTHQGYNRNLVRLLVRIQGKVLSIHDSIQLSSAHRRQ